MKIFLLHAVGDADCTLKQMFPVERFTSLICTSFILSRMNVSNSKQMLLMRGLYSHDSILKTLQMMPLSM